MHHDLFSPLGMGIQSGERLQQVFCYKAEAKIMGLDLEGQGREEDLQVPRQEYPASVLLLLLFYQRVSFILAYKRIFLQEYVDLSSGQTTEENVSHTPPPKNKYLGTR